MNEIHLEKINKVSFRQLSAYSITNCVEDRAVLVDNLSRFPFGGAEKSIIAADFIILLFCTEGCLEISMDGKRHRLCKGDILFCGQGATLHVIMMPLSCKCKALCVSWEYARSLFLRSTCQWDSILQVRNNPLLQPSVSERELYQAYYRLFFAKISCDCHASDIDCILQVFFHDLYRMADRYAMQKSRQRISRASTRQEDLFKRFISLLKEKHGHEHSCTFYAEQLYVTPKYLTTVVKKVSGSSVSQWIDIYLIDQIKCRLKTTSLSVSEIANELNFSNASFFGKYVKRHTGESPTKLRHTLLEA